MVGNCSVIQNQCFNCKQIGHWKKECPELKNRQKGESVDPSQVNVAKLDGEDSYSSTFSLSISPSNNHSDASEWVLDTGATYHICPGREMFDSFEKLNGGIMLFGDGHT